MKKRDFSRKIIKILSEKPAVSLSEIEKKVSIDKGSKYALNRSIKGLQDSGIILNIDSGQNKYAKLTKEGKKKAHSIKLECENAMISNTWDGLWRIIILDVEEDRKNEREAIRYLLKKAGFVSVKNSVWVSMYPFEYLFTNIKNDLGLTTELMIIVTDKIDKETEKEFLSICLNKKK